LKYKTPAGHRKIIFGETGTIPSEQFKFYHAPSQYSFALTRNNPIFAEQYQAENGWQNNH